MQGLGLYAARDIEKCTMVIEYIGTIIRSEVANRKERLYEAQVTLSHSLLTNVHSAQSSGTGKRPYSVCNATCVWVFACVCVCGPFIIWPGGSYTSRLCQQVLTPHYGKPAGKWSLCLCKSYSTVCKHYGIYITFLARAPTSRLPLHGL